MILGWGWPGFSEVIQAIMEEEKVKTKEGKTHTSPIERLIGEAPEQATKATSEPKMCIGTILEDRKFQLEQSIHSKHTLQEGLASYNRIVKLRVSDDYTSI